MADAMVWRATNFTLGEPLRPAPPPMPGGAVSIASWRELDAAAAARGR